MASATCSNQLHIKHFLAVDTFGCNRKEEYILKSLVTKALFIRRILVASNAIKTIDNETKNLVKAPFTLYRIRLLRYLRFPFKSNG